MARIPLLFLSRLNAMFYWILFLPFFQIALLVFECKDGLFVYDNDIVCYGGVHMIFVVKSIIDIMYAFLKFKI